MGLGISIDASDCATSIPLLDQWNATIKHVQFYLGANLNRIDVSSIRKVVRYFGHAFSYSFHAYGYLNPSEENDLARNAWLNTGKESIDFLYDIGGKFVNFHIGNIISSSISRQSALLRAKESIFILCEHGFSRQIDINIENDFSSNEIVRLGDNLDDFHLFFQRRPMNLYMCYDIGHANISFPSAYDYQKFFGIIQSFHLHNNDGINDLHLPIGGSGTIDLLKVYAQLSSMHEYYLILENDFNDYAAALTCISKCQP